MNIKLALIVGGIILLASGITYAFASDDNGCAITDQHNWLWNSNYNVICWLIQINHSQQIQIQEQNQTNNLLASEICTHMYSASDINNFFDSKNKTNIFGQKTITYYYIIHDCIQKVLEDTK